MRRAQLWSSLLILLALGGALALAGPGGATPAEPVAGANTAGDASDALDPEQLARISLAATPRVAREVERVRGLRFDELPKPEVVTSRFLNRLGARQLRNQPGGLGTGADNAFGWITGQLAADEDVASIYGATGDLAAAAYDPKSKRLYIVSDAVVANRALVEFVLAHELDHALEDQNFGLDSGPARRNDDAALAAQALDEGSATDLMIEFAARYLNPLELLAASDTIDSGTGGVPKAYVEQLTWSYLGGRKFVAALRELGGGWKLVDYAFESRPPATTEQVLHARKYIADERPDPVRIDGAPLRRSGWELADRNVLGELATSVLLETGVDKEAARAAAAGWDGDRYELWRRDVAPGDCEYPCRSDLVVVMKWRFDSPAEALPFERAVRGYLSDGLHGKKLGGPAWRLDGGYAALGTAGGATALAFAPTEWLARRTAGAQIP